MKFQLNNIVGAVFLPVSLFIIGLGKLWYVGKVPKSPSLDELNLLQNCGLHLSTSDFSYRILAVVLAALVPVLLYLVMKKYCKDQLAAYIISVVTTVSPWFTALSLTLNPFLLVVTLILGIYVLPLSPLFQFMASALVLLSPAFTGHTISFAPPLESITNILRSIDLKTLFITGDFNSTFLRIPKTGFFMLIDVVFLVWGSWTVGKNRRGILPVVSLLALGILQIVFFSNTLPAFRSTLLLLSLSIMIGFGYYSLLMKAKHNILFLLILVVTMINFFYYQNLLVAHFDKKNSGDWTYAEMQIVEYLKAMPAVHRLVLGPHEETVKTVVGYYLPTLKITTVETVQLAKECAAPHTFCVIKGEHLKGLNMREEETKNMFNVYSGLTLYYGLKTE
ncbi:hypothetical protein HGB07_01045 [Candidatus Roizmanbacteria bacterium]|nr:hypothetical protein [Candidatus Roizmanbacteria bacterium]